MCVPIKLVSDLPVASFALGVDFMNLCYKGMEEGVVLLQKETEVG